jgi:uncharacterized membrane protein
VSESTRLEAFSDGVMAIAITLLVLDLIVPTREELSAQHTTLSHALGALWPNYAAYVVSFLVIGIIWVNHHALFGLIGQVDRWVLFSNLLMLMVVSAIPFPTRLLAEYLTAGGSASHLAAAVYSATMLAMAVAFTALYIAGTRPQMLRPGVDPAAMRRALPRFSAGVGLYAVTVAVSFISAPVTLAVHFGLAVYYVFDQTGAVRADTVQAGDTAPATRRPPGGAAG